MNAGFLPWVITQKHANTSLLDSACIILFLGETKQVWHVLLFDRVLRVHENVMAVMMNTLGRRAQAQSDAQPASPQQPTEDNKEKVCVELH